MKSTGKRPETVQKPRFQCGGRKKGVDAGLQLGAKYKISIALMVFASTPCSQKGAAWHALLAQCIAHVSVMVSREGRECRLDSKA